ncbi:SpoIIE family protein phosphatase [Streptomyces sp. NPDC047829]|uniref:SpoIIE family protein phosphatase n=1 Tax=Streptomyces sp. NPDC047829 TaxID=3154609 RepID=UPI0033C2C30F
MAGGTPPARHVPLDRRETVLMVTDGVTEARDETGAFFPLRSWLELLSPRRPDGVGPTELLDAVIEAVLDHTGGRLTGDAALLAVRRHAPRSAVGPA